MSKIPLSRRPLLASGATVLLAVGLLGGGAAAQARPLPSPTLGPTPPTHRPWPPWGPPIGPAFASCESLDSLPAGQVVTNSAPPTNSYQPPLLDIAAHPFTWWNGVSTSAGQATTGTAGKAGGSGTEIGVNNITLSISRGFGQVLKAVRIRFGEYGGNLNLEINGVSVNVDDFAKLNGKVIGGVAVSVPSGGFGNDHGVVEFTGTMPDQPSGLGQIAVGGQELWIDDICFDQ